MASATILRKVTLLCEIPIKAVTLKIIYIYLKNEQSAFNFKAGQIVVNRILKDACCHQNPIS